MSQFHCKHCGRGIFRSDDILREVNLWDLGDYQAECYAIGRAIAPETLRRYDVSLHEGWYCCRFIMMRMTVDKFGTGDQLLVYKDSVVEIADDAEPPAQRPNTGRIRLTSRDHDTVIASPEHRNQLLMVKFGAIWCPPCRLMDKVFDEITAEGSLPQVRFFEVDSDEEPELAGRWRNQSIPYTVFYYNGRQVPLQLSNRPTIDGGLLGGLRKAELVTLCQRVLEELLGAQAATARG